MSTLRNGMPGKCTIREIDGLGKGVAVQETRYSSDKNSVVAELPDFFTNASPVGIAEVAPVPRQRIATTVAKNPHTQSPWTG